MHIQTSGTLEVVDAETGDLAFEITGIQWWDSLWVESPARWVIHTSNNRLIDLETGEQVTVATDDWLYVEATNEVVMNDPTTGEVILRSLNDGTVRRTGVVGDWFEASRTVPRY